MLRLAVKKRQEPLGIGGSCLVLLSAAAISLGISAILLMLQDKSPVQGVSLLFQGAFGSRWALEDCLKDLKRRQLEQQRKHILDLMAKARSDGDVESERSLALRKIDVEREIHETR